MANRRLTLEEEMRRLEAVDDYLSTNHQNGPFECKDTSYCKEVGYLGGLRKNYGTDLELLGGLQGDQNSVVTIDIDVYDCPEVQCMIEDRQPFGDQYDLEDWMVRVREVCDEVLTAREYDIFFKFFGVDNDREYDFMELAEMYDLSRERVRQIFTHAWRKLARFKWGERLLVEPNYKKFKPINVDKSKITEAVDRIIYGGRNPDLVFKYYLNSEERKLARVLLSHKLKDRAIKFIKGESLLDVTPMLYGYISDDDRVDIHNYKVVYPDKLGHFLRFCMRSGRLPKSKLEPDLYAWMKRNSDNPKVQEAVEKYSV